MGAVDVADYLALTGRIDPKASHGLFYDRANGDLVLVMDGAVVQRWNSPTGEIEDGFVASDTRGDLARRGATGWERLDANDSGKVVMGDGTDVVSQAISGDATLAGTGALTVTDVTVGSDATGDLQYKSSATALARLGIGTPGQQLRVNSAGTAPTWTDDATSIDFTTEREVPLFAKTTGAIKTAVNAQQDFFWVGGRKYMELTQGVGATGANTLLAANGLTPSTTGWLLTLDNTATDSLEITEGITLGSARSFVAGTSAAFTLKCAFLITTRDNITHLSMGFRVLGAYVTANTYTEMKTAYDDKAMIGIGDNAGALRTDTSLATVDVSTALAHAAAANGDILALQVLVSAAGVTTYKLATATPAGSTAAQTQAAVAAAYAALATDASAVAYTFGAVTVVPSIIIAASGAAAPDVKLVNYFCGLQ
jgi:hypothetical protein